MRRCRARARARAGLLTFAGSESVDEWEGLGGLCDGGGGGSRGLEFGGGSRMLAVNGPAPRRAGKGMVGRKAQSSAKATDRATSFVPKRGQPDSLNGSYPSFLSL